MLTLNVVVTAVAWAIVNRYLLLDRKPFSFSTVFAFPVGFSIYLIFQNAWLSLAIAVLAFPINLVLSSFVVLALDKRSRE